MRDNYELVGRVNLDERIQSPQNSSKKEPVKGESGSHAGQQKRPPEFSLSAGQGKNQPRQAICRQGQRQSGPGCVSESRTIDAFTVKRGRQEIGQYPGGMALEQFSEQPPSNHEEGSQTSCLQAGQRQPEIALSISRLQNTGYRFGAEKSKANHFGT
jgi:hypothetical protein